MKFSMMKTNILYLLLLRPAFMTGCDGHVETIEPEAEAIIENVDEHAVSQEIAQNVATRFMNSKVSVETRPVILILS